MTLNLWMGFSLNCHPSFSKMFILCYKYQDLSNLLRNLREEVDGYLIAEVQTLSLAIIEEYKKILEANFVGDDDKKEPLSAKIQNDILFTISGWFDKSDKSLRLRNLSNDFLSPIRNELMDMYLPLFKATIDSFINSRIRIVYEEAVKLRSKELPLIFNSFLNSSLDDENFGELEDWHLLMQKFRNSKVSLVCEECNLFQQFLENLHHRAPFISTVDVEDFAGYIERITIDLALLTNQKFEIFNFSKSFVQELSLKDFNGKMLATQAFLGKIYYSLLKSYEELKIRELESFVNINASKVGLFPAFNTEKSLTIPRKKDKDLKTGDSNPFDLGGGDFFATEL